MKLNPIYKGILCCGLALPVTALAQGSGEAIEEIVVTGSLIKGTPEDAALPVEVHTSEQLALEGAPTALEFAKTLTSSGPTTGEAHYFGGAANTGNVQFNLRGLGSDKTLTLFNGRRVSQNTSLIPGIATQRIEVLKDGAAVTYGADATGGVVNFITRDFYEGFEFDASYKFVDGSDGEYDIAMMGGFGGDDTNIILAAEWEHRSQLKTEERPFTTLSYGENPAPWSDLTNLAAWAPYNTSLGIGNLSLNPPADFTQESCEAVGGVYNPDYLSTSPYNPAVCKYNYIPYYDLVAENDIYRLYGQINSAVTDNMDFHLRLAFSRVRSPAVHGSPAQPVIRGPATAAGAAFQFAAPTSNPYVADFAARSGWDQSPLYGLTNEYRAFLYRGFAHNGNPFLPEGDNYGVPSEIDHRYWHLSTGLDGNFENGITYDFGITYNKRQSYSDAPDIMGYRLQEALNGFGGPNCNAQDLDPDTFGTQNPGAAGTNGCMWWNPFASGWAGQPTLGLANPSYVPGTENSRELAEWLFDKRAQEDFEESVTADLLFSGDTGVELPGGTIAWGAGLQWRQTDLHEVVQSPFYNGAQPCAWPDQEPAVPGTPEYTGCTPDRPGPFVFFDTNPPDQNHQDQRSAFTEFNFPIIDTLYLTAAARYEEFSGGLDATVYKVSGKWDATENLSFRAAFGTNYQAPPPSINPGEVNNGTNSFTIAGGNWRGAQTVTQSGIEPETAEVGSLGLIWQSQGFSADHDFRLIIDYFDIETEDELGLLASANDVATAVFSIAPPGETRVPTDGTALADCSHVLVDRVTFNGGECIQGVTTASNFSNVRTDYGNGPGQHTAGFDIQMNYSMPFMAGDLSFDLTATKVEKDINGATTLDGYVVTEEDDRLGNLNFATVAFASSEWRANLRANYAQDIHNFRVMLNYISGVDDERFLLPDGSVNTAALVPSGLQANGQPFGPTDFGVRGEDWITVDLHYNVELPWDATFTASINNVADEMPPESRQELGYDPRIGNPLGRTFEIGFKKRF
ncbi:TonB-dependent receptor plug domain-containing protein [Proteobacteria bacterium 005FR1]|nr:TonB-dependent receptor plug domain-containing protein [Proteobacteria bacterium 005FR1]